MKRNLISLAVLAALGLSASAQALEFTFDPTGTPGAAGDITGISLIDQAPGSALAVGGITAIQNFASGGGSTGFTLLYQANLSAMQAADTSIKFANGTGGKFFTFVAGFGERVTGLTQVGVNATATFGADLSNPVNFFTMYATSAIGNNLTGNGFATGTAILSGHLSSIGSSNFNVPNVTASTVLDQSPNGDQWAGQRTVTGSGSSDLTLVVDSVDTNYFPDLDALTMLLLSFFNTSQVDPFRQVDPSRCLHDGTGTCDGGTGTISVGTLGAINGNANPALGTTGPNFIMQADANQAFAVPEPTTVALLGLGLAALGFRRRSQG